MRPEVETNSVYLIRAYLEKGDVLFIDEIHQYKNWSQELKNIYDSYPDVKVIFSGSSMAMKSRTEATWPSLPD